MIGFYLMIALVVLAFLYMGHASLKTLDLSIEVIELNDRMDRLEAEIFECFKIMKKDVTKEKDSDVRRIK